MRLELEELAELAKGATEREIETEVVNIFKQSGWPRSQINQDVPISDKGADKADIVLRLDGVPMILVEVKKYGQLKDAENQVNRYCRLLRPSPKLAFLTDGVRWIFYYAGQSGGAIPVQESVVPSETADLAALLTGLNPAALSVSLQAGVFQFLDIVEQGLQERSEDVQKHLRHLFASSVRALLLPAEDAPHFAVSGVVAPQEQPIQVEESRQSETRRGIPQDDLYAEYDAAGPPSLTFTTLISAKFAGGTATNWNDLLRLSVKTALSSGRSIQDIRRATSINILEGAVTDRGYSPVAETNVSVQGLTADESWQNALKLAEKLGCLIEAKFRWRDNEKASHPGESGLLHWRP